MKPGIIALAGTVRKVIDRSSAEQRALESDLSLAARIQRALLPKPGLAPAGWDVRYHYQPAGMVSGDYCDLFETEGGLLFMLGDASVQPNRAGYSSRDFQRHEEPPALTRCSPAPDVVFYAKHAYSTPLPLFQAHPPKTRRMHDSKDLTSRDAA